MLTLLLTTAYAANNIPDLTTGAFTSSNAVQTGPHANSILSSALKDRIDLPFQSLKLLLHLVKLDHQGLMRDIRNGQFKQLFFVTANSVLPDLYTDRGIADSFQRNIWSTNLITRSDEQRFVRGIWAMLYRRITRIGRTSKGESVYDLRAPLQVAFEKLGLSSFFPLKLLAGIPGVSTVIERQLEDFLCYLSVRIFYAAQGAGVPDAFKTIYTKACSWLSEKSNSISSAADPIPQSDDAPDLGSSLPFESIVFPILRNILIEELEIFVDECFMPTLIEPLSRNVCQYSGLIGGSLALGCAGVLTGGIIPMFASGGFLGLMTGRGISWASAPFLSHYIRNNLHYACEYLLYSTMPLHVPEYFRQHQGELANPVLRSIAIETAENTKPGHRTPEQESLLNRFKGHFLPESPFIGASPTKPNPALEHNPTSGLSRLTGLCRGFLKGLQEDFLTTMGRRKLYANIPYGLIQALEERLSPSEKRRFDIIFKYPYLRQEFAEDLNEICGSFQFKDGWNGNSCFSLDRAESLGNYDFCCIQPGLDSVRRYIERTKQEEQKFAKRLESFSPNALDDLENHRDKLQEKGFFADRAETKDVLLLKLDSQFGSYVGLLKFSEEVAKRIYPSLCKTKLSSATNSSWVSSIFSTSSSSSSSSVAPSVSSGSAPESQEIRTRKDFVLRYEEQLDGEIEGGEKSDFYMKLKTAVNPRNEDAVWVLFKQKCLDELQKHDQPIPEEYREKPQDYACSKFSGKLLWEMVMIKLGDKFLGTEMSLQRNWDSFLEIQKSRSQLFDLLQQRGYENEMLAALSEKFTDFMIFGLDKVLTDMIKTSIISLE